MGSKIDLSIIIVNWNVAELLEKCLDSIFQHQDRLKIEVFVVDNNSSDSSVEVVKKKFPQVKLIANKENLGFARANNQAIKESSGDFVLLLNPDTEILDNALEKMVDLMRQKEEIAIAGCRVLYPDKTTQLSVRRFPRMYDMLIVFLKVHNFLPELLSEYYCFDFDYEKEQEVDQVMGAFFMIRRSVIEKIGLLDENFYIWMEEVDYCKRTEKAGWKVIYYPGAEIIHYGARSFKQLLTLKRQKILNDSILYYFKKHNSKLAYLILYCLQPLSYFFSLIVSIFYGSKAGRSVHR